MSINNIDIQDDKGNSYRPMANPDSVTEFTKAASRTNIASGDSHRTVFGKICKFFADMGAAAYIAIANNCTTTAAGFALDARQGKIIMDKVTQQNSDLGGLEFKEDSSGKYVRGADSVWVPFSSIAYIANFKGKYGTGNNSVITATPGEIQGYELALYGFTNLYISGAMHVAAISADNNHVQAGSQYGSVISVTYGGYFVKTGTPYIIKEHSLVKTSTVNLSNNIPGYRLVGGVLHFSDYSSSQTGGAAIGNLAMDNSTNIMIADVSFQYSAVTVSAKLLYLPG